MVTNVSMDIETVVSKSPAKSKRPQKSPAKTIKSADPKSPTKKTPIKKTPAAKVSTLLLCVLCSLGHLCVVKWSSDCSVREDSVPGSEAYCNSGRPG